MRRGHVVELALALVLLAGVASAQLPAFDATKRPTCTDGKPWAVWLLNQSSQTDCDATAGGTVDAFCCCRDGVIASCPTTFPEKGVLLGKLIGANFNSTADQSIAIIGGRYIVEEIMVTNASISLTTAAGGVYPAVAKGGTAWVAAAQVYSALTAASKYVYLSLQPTLTTDTHTTATVYLSLTTAQGAAATADVYLYGERLE